MLFEDRDDAGRKLALKVADHAGAHDAVVVGLSRGGVAVAAAVARTLSAALDVCLVSQLTLPGRQEFSMGAISSSGVLEINAHLIESLHVPQRAVDRTVLRERAKLEQRFEQHRRIWAGVSVDGKPVVLIDDGMGNGFGMRVAVRELRSRGARTILIAVPVGAPEALAEARDFSDDLVFISAPYPFHSVGQFYADFPKLTDDEVDRLVVGQVSEGAAIPGLVTIPGPGESAREGAHCTR